MHKITDKFLSDLLKKHSINLVGRLCKQIESLQKDLDKNSIEFKYLSHAKELHREKVYETFRDIKNEVRTYNSGLKYHKFTLTPSKQQKVV
jgi:hypothetical protein